MIKRNASWLQWSQGRQAPRIPGLASRLTLRRTMGGSEPLKGNSPRAVPWAAPGLTQPYLAQGFSDWPSENGDEEQWSAHLRTGQDQFQPVLKSCEPRRLSCPV